MTTVETRGALELDNDTLKHCIFSLLKGLEIQDIDSFMENLSPVSCLKLGRAYMQAVTRLAGRRGRVDPSSICLALNENICKETGKPCDYCEGE